MRRLMIFILMLFGFGLRAQIQPFSIDSSFQSHFDFRNTYSEWINNRLVRQSGGTIKDIWEDKSNGQIYLVGDFDYTVDTNHYFGHISLESDGSHFEDFIATFGSAFVFFPINDSVFFSGLDGERLMDKRGKAIYSWSVNQNNSVPCDVTIHTYFYKDGSSLWSNSQGNFNGCAIVVPPDTFPHRYIVKVDPEGKWDSTFTIDADQAGINFLGYDSTRILMYSYPRYTIQYGNYSVNGIWRTYLDGTFDSTFNSPVSDSLADGGFIPVVNDDGSIFLLGSFLLEGDSDYHTLVKLNSDGSLDSTFMNNAGPTDSTGAFSSVTAIAPTEDGGYLVGGIFNEYQGYERNGIAKIDQYGTLEPNYFNGEGIDSAFIGNPYISEILPSAFGGYYVVGNFRSWDGQPSQPIIRLHGMYVGLEEHGQEIQELKVFPNPASEKISFYGTANEEPEEVLLIDIQGKSTKAKINNTGFNSYEIDISDLQSGMYFLKLLSDGEVSVGKFVKE